MSIILGIDPGSRITGFGVISTANKTMTCLECGVIKMQTETLAERLHEIHSGIREIITQFQPQEVSIEEVFFHRNPRAALKLGQARGAAIVAAAESALPVAEYSPRQIKQSVVGYGAAQKEQVQHMIRVLLNLSITPPPDAADALAIALCHANMRQGVTALASKGQMRRGRLR